MIPSDIRGPQADVLESVLRKIRHPAMRARVADVVWTSDRREPSRPNWQELLGPEAVIEVERF